mgnify:CR=1 FL=1
MKLKILFFVFLLVCSSCALDKRDIISSNFDFADIQLKHAFVEMDSVYKSTDKLLANPRNIDPNGFLRMVASGVASTRIFKRISVFCSSSS